MTARSFNIRFEPRFTTFFIVPFFFFPNISDEYLLSGIRENRDNRTKISFPIDEVDEK